MAAVHALIFSVLLVTAPAQAESSDLIQEIEVRGNHRVPADTIKYRIQTKAGDLLNSKTVSRDVKTLYSLGYFDDVRVEEQRVAGGLIIVFHVQERPLIQTIKYEGVQSATTSEINETLRNRKVEISPNTPYDPARIRRAEAVIQQMYAEKGHRNARIATRVDKTDNGVGVVFDVDEGPKLKVEDITFQGNKAISDRELKRTMKLIKESGPITLFTRSNTYDELKLNEDIARIRMHYATKGYIRANVHDPVINIKPKTIYRTFPFIKPDVPWGIPIPFSSKREDRIHLTLKVEENAQYRVGQVTVTGNQEFSSDNIRFVLGVVPGTIYNEERLRKGLDNLRKMYGSRGYINFTAVPLYDFVEQTRVVNLIVNVDEDRKFYINRISFSGNTTTRDKVIRRELKIAEGDVFNSSLWDLSLVKLNQLGYFEPVRAENTDMKLDPQTNSVDLNLKVKEKDSNRISFDGGVSGMSGTYLGVGYSTNNFLGLGETMSVNLEGGTRMSQYQFTFTEPYTFSRPLSTSFSVFSTRSQYDQSYLDLLQKRSGFSVGSTYPLGVFQRLGLAYQFDNSHISSVDAPTQEFFSTLATNDQNASTYFTRRLISSYTFNSVNNPMKPTTGYSFTASMESAGGLFGGNANFYRPGLEFKAFKPVQGGRNTLALRVSGSHVRALQNKSVPFYERFFVGGDYDLRGFDYRSISPIAFIRRTTNGVSFDDVVRVGGDTQAVLNFEYRIPLGGPFTLAPFVDVGNSWVTDSKALQRLVTNGAGQIQREDVRLLSGTNAGVRASAGVELQITLPVIHLPLRLIFAVNPSRIDQTYTGPTAGTPLSVREPSHGFKFTIGKTF